MSTYDAVNETPARDELPRRETPAPTEPPEATPQLSAADKPQGAAAAPVPPPLNDRETSPAAAPGVAAAEGQASEMDALATAGSTPEPVVAPVSAVDLPSGEDLEGAATPMAEQPPCEGCPAAQSGEGQAADGGDAQHPRVMLEAGTDPESLKALALCREKVQQLRLKMHPLAARWDDDRHVTIFFRADEKVDFRKLVRELSWVLRARIELRQVGPREQGKLCGLVGKCGYELCCRTFLTQFAQSSIKMAKVQDLALNPMKISGVCGRLLCCLNYEQQLYAEAKSRMPRVNRIVDTEYGQGRVVSVNVLRDTVTVQFETGTRELPPDQVRLAEGQS